MNPANRIALSISKRICQSFGGSCSVVSRPNVGSNFKLTMKVYPKKSRRNAISSPEDADENMSSEYESSAHDQTNNQAVNANSPGYVLHQSEIFLDVGNDR